jgi:hypothetical protein
MNKRMDGDFSDVDFLEELMPVELGKAFGEASLIGSKSRSGLTGSNSSGNAQDGGGSGNWNVFKTS